MVAQFSVPVSEPGLEPLPFGFLVERGTNWTIQGDWKGKMRIFNEDDDKQFSYDAKQNDVGGRLAVWTALFPGYTATWVRIPAGPWVLRLYSATFAAPWVGFGWDRLCVRYKYRIYFTFVYMIVALKSPILLMTATIVIL